MLAKRPGSRPRLGSLCQEPENARNQVYTTDIADNWVVRVRALDCNQESDFETRGARKMKQDVSIVDTNHEQKLCFE